jgi:hypothetical protein
LQFAIAGKIHCSNNTQDTTAKMDMVAAIQAAKNQLEEQKKKRGITANTAAQVTTANLPSISLLHPAPPTNIVSFDSKKQRASPHPYHNNSNSHNSSNDNNQADYIHPDYQYKSNPDEEDDELTTTSSLSGTLPSSVVHDIPHHIHRSESSGLGSSGFGLLDTVKESPGSAAAAAAAAARSKSFIVADSPKVEIDQDVTPNRRSKSLYVKEVPGLPLQQQKQNATVGGGGGGGGATTNAGSSSRVGNSATIGTQSTKTNQNALDFANNNTNTAAAPPTTTSTTTNHASKDNNSNVSKRIDEIMSAYQGKVDTILKRRDEGTSFKTIMETASAQGGAGSSSVTSSVSKRSTEGLGVDDIMATYQKKVGEIMEKKQQAAAMSSSNHSVGSSKNTYDDDMENRRQELSSRSRPSYPRSIVDDETTESREGAIDKSVEGSHTSRGRSQSSYSRGSRYSGSRSYTDDEYSDDGSMGKVDDKKESSGAVAKKPAGPMSERANAIWQSLDAKQPLSSRSLSPMRNKIAEDGATSNNDDNRSVYSKNSYSTNDSQSYISGASSASNALGSTYSREYSKEGQPQDRVSNGESSNTSGASQNKDKPDPLLRKDSLRQAQEQLARKLPKLSKSFYCEPNSTKGNLHAEIETERKFRQDLERRLAESTQREEDLSNENRRIEKALADLQSQLNKVQGDARSNKYSQSEQAARIRELERKLLGEQNRVEELEREKDAMKEEVSVIWKDLGVAGVTSPSSDA